MKRPEKPSPKHPETPTPEGCPTCAEGAPCVLHAPLFRELVDLPGVPAGPPLPVHETPPAFPFHRPRRPRSAADRDTDVQRLGDLVERLAQWLARVEALR